MSRLVEYTGTVKEPLQKDAKLSIVNIYGAPIDRTFKYPDERVYKVKTNTTSTIDLFTKAGVKFILSISETPGKDNPDEVTKFMRSVDPTKLITVIPSDGAIFNKRFLVVKPPEVVIAESTSLQRIMNHAKRIFDIM